MPAPLITLTTDFGEESPYVAAMKGVILSINPFARILDLSHGIPPQDVRYAAFFLAGAVPYFPPDVIHVVVVDPGVGGERALLYVSVGGHRLVVPDNGCWTSLIKAGDSAPSVIRLTDARYWRAEVSHTFHGRDILAPVAAHLSLGLDPYVLGPAIAPWVTLPQPKAERREDGWHGEVVFVDHFGNLITNLPPDALDQPIMDIEIGDKRLAHCSQARSYSDVDPGKLLLLVSSAKTVELAVNQGNAAQQLGVRAGVPIRLRASYA